MEVTTRVAIGLGSNCGTRLEHLRYGVARLRRVIDDLRTSSVYETQPMYRIDQEVFLNACCVGVTHLTPRQLLSALLDAERAAGRRRGGTRFGPRELDLDLLLYGDLVLESDHLILPHPRIRERAFVLVPLAAIARDWIVPAAPDEEAATVSALAATVPQAGIERTEYEL